MKVKPKEILVNLPVVLLFKDESEAANLASGFNTFIHGKVHVKYDILGILTEQTVVIFYLQRNNEFHSLRENFIELIEREELPQENFSFEKHNTNFSDNSSENYNPNFGDDKLCLCGHVYYRHFDSHDNMEPIGCKYCRNIGNKYGNGSCGGFKLAPEHKENCSCKSCVGM